MKYNILVRNYNPEKDYEWVAGLYKDSATFWGQFDEARDSEEKLSILSKSSPNKILIAEINNNIVGTVTLFEDGRSAWLYRFAVQKEYEAEIAHALYDRWVKILKELWYSQVLIYGPVHNSSIQERYLNLWLQKGWDYSAYWTNI